jgi:hypothetical protein
MSRNLKGCGLATDGMLGLGNGGCQGDVGVCARVDMCLESGKFGG